MECCFECGDTGELHNHHVVPKSLGGTKTIPLCPKCHGLVHNRNFLQLKSLQAAGIARAKAEGKKWGGADNTKRIGRDEFIRRTKAGQEKAKSEGKTVGRNITTQAGIPKKLTPEILQQAKNLRDEGKSWEHISKIVGISRRWLSKAVEQHSIKEKGEQSCSASLQAVLVSLGESSAKNYESSDMK